MLVTPHNTSEKLPSSTTPKTTLIVIHPVQLDVLPTTPLVTSGDPHLPTEQKAATALPVMQAAQPDKHAVISCAGILNFAKIFFCTSIPKKLAALGVKVSVRAMHFLEWLQRHVALTRISAYFTLQRTKMPGVCGRLEQRLGSLLYSVEACAQCCARWLKRKFWSRVRAAATTGVFILNAAYYAVLQITFLTMDGVYIEFSAPYLVYFPAYILICYSIVAVLLARVKAFWPVMVSFVIFLVTMWVPARVARNLLAGEDVLVVISSLRVSRKWITDELVADVRKNYDTADFTGVELREIVAYSGSKAQARLDFEQARAVKEAAKRAMQEALPELASASELAWWEYVYSYMPTKEQVLAGVVVAAILFLLGALARSGGAGGGETPLHDVAQRRLPRHSHLQRRRQVVEPEPKLNPNCPGYNLVLYKRQGLRPTVSALPDGEKPPSGAIIALPHGPYDIVDECNPRALRYDPNNLAWAKIRTTDDLGTITDIYLQVDGRIIHNQKALDYLVDHHNINNVLSNYHDALFY